MEMQPQNEFKPNIYPLMYWALAFGAIAGVVLFLINILSQYITLLWFPVFVAGMVWGGYRNYQRQKEAWAKGTGVPLTPQSPMQEFRQAVGDVVLASREMMAEQRAEEAAQAEQAMAQQEEVAPEQPEEELPPENFPPQNPPTIQ